jgi:hypothetical protein
MADERDPQISQRYRELGTEEPTPELDRAILAAARRATSRHRWYSSLAAAAVIIFAVAIVIQIERQPPDQVPMSAPSTPVVAPPSAEPAAPEKREARPAMPAKAPPRRSAEQAPQFAPEPPPRVESLPATPAPAPAPAPEPSANVAAPAAGAAPDMPYRRMDEPRAAPQPQRSMAARSEAMSTAQLERQSPERWLERIARLRQLGRDEEAEKELARFRESYPDYRIPEAMAKRLEKQTPSPAAK